MVWRGLFDVCLNEGDFFLIFPTSVHEEGVSFLESEY